MKRSWWEYRDWSFVADMNHDGAVNLADALMWLQWLFLLPGDAIIAKIGMTPLGQMLGLTPQSFGGSTSAFLSAAAWLLLLYLPRFVVDAADPTYRQRKREAREAVKRAEARHKRKGPRRALFPFASASRLTVRREPRL